MNKQGASDRAESIDLHSYVMALAAEVDAMALGAGWRAELATYVTNHMDVLATNHPDLGLTLPAKCADRLQYEIESADWSPLIESGVAEDRRRGFQTVVLVAMELCGASAADLAQVSESPLSQAQFEAASAVLAASSPPAGDGDR